MAQTVWQFETDHFYRPAPALFTAASEAANRLRCATEDVAAARDQYVLRRRQIGLANRQTWMRRAQKGVAMRMFNKARAALARAERALAALPSA